MRSPEKLPIEDLKHFGDSLWRNEEAGEKRFNFFVTLITAVAAGLTTLHTAKDLAPAINREQITTWAIAGLLLFGAMTYLRMLQRVRVRREYHATLEYIRGQLVKLGQGPSGYSVPLKAKESKLKKALSAGFKGGFTFLVGVINAVLAGVLTYTASHDTCSATLVGIAALIVFWGVAVYMELRA